LRSSCVDVGTCGIECDTVHTLFTKELGKDKYFVQGKSNDVTSGSIFSVVSDCITE